MANDLPNVEIESRKAAATDDQLDDAFASSRMLLRGSTTLTSPNPIMIAPKRRPLIVLAVLIASMTAASGLLMLLEPGPITTPMRPISLRAETAQPAGWTSLFDTAATAREWSAIVIYESGPKIRSVEQLTAARASRGLGPLPYHFVIDDSHDDPDQTIQAGYRWRQQLDSAAATGPHRDWYNGHAISICLIGDSHSARLDQVQMRHLGDLVQRLQRRFDIAPHLVRLHSETDPAASTGRYFSIGYLQQRLLSPSR